MSKFLLNLLLQFSKALVKKNLIFNSKIPFSLFSVRPTLRPTRPLAQPAHWPRRPRRPKYVFPFASRLSSRSPLPRLSVNRAPAVSSIPHLQPPELARAATAPRPPSAAQLHASGATGPLPARLQFPSLKSPLKHSPVFSGVKTINAGVKLPVHPSLVLPRSPIKGENPH
jgi:hypothetical protein